MSTACFTPRASSPPAAAGPAMPPSSPPALAPRPSAGAGAERWTNLPAPRHDPDALVTTAETEADRRFVEEVRSAGKGDLGEGIRALLPQKERLLGAVGREREQNPMLGLRGCRLGVTMPEVTEMQVRAVFEAACALQKEGVDVHPEVMIPLVGHVNELRHQREALEVVVKRGLREQGGSLGYKVG